MLSAMIARDRRKRAQVAGDYTAAQHSCPDMNEIMRKVISVSAYNTR